MKYLRARFENFVGIWYGLHLKNFEIDFTKCKNRITLILGHNGSGKSSFLESLTLFTDIISALREPNDFIIRDKDGHRNGAREIYFVNGDKYYVSKCYWIDNTTKAYLFETDASGKKELKDFNPSGNVRSYEEQLEINFGLTKNIQKLMFIGASMSTIITMTPSGRKQMISNFVPDIDQYLKMYKDTAKYHSKLKNDISTITSEIHKLGDDREKIEASVDSLNEKKDLSEEELNWLRSIRSKTENVLQVLSVNGKPLSEVYQQKVKFNNSSVEELHRMNASFTYLCDKLELQTGLSAQEYSNILDEYNTNHTTMTVKLENYNSRCAEIKSSINTLKDTLETKRAMLQQYTENNDPQKFIESSKVLNDELVQIDSSIDTIVSKYPDIDRDSLLFNSDDATKYLVFIDTVMNRIDELSKMYGYGNILNKWVTGELAEEYSSDYSDKLVLQYDNLKAEHDAMTNLLAETGGSVTFVSLLEKVNCENRKCPFIEAALRYKDVISKDKSIREKISRITNEMADVQRKIDDWNNFRTKAEAFSVDIYRFQESINKYIELYSKFPDYQILSDTKQIFRNTAFLLPHAREWSELAHLNDRKIEICQELVKVKDLIEKAVGYYDSVNVQKKEILDMEVTVQNTEKSLEQLHNDNSALIDAEVELRDRISNLRTVIELRQKIVDGLRKFNLNRQMMKRLKKHYIAARFFEDRLRQLNARISGSEETLMQCNSELSSAQYNLRRFDEFDNRREELTKDYDLLSTLRDCWSPTTGVPLVFINRFMSTLIADANQYLSEIFSEYSFYISDFEIDDKNFIIRIFRGDPNSCKDASQCSDAERQMLCTVISLALLKQVPDVANSFNIAKFDEIDGCLDYDKRRIFTDILNRLLDGIHCEQAFMISHSDTVQNDVDVMLLRGSEEYEGRLLNSNFNVIYRY